MKKCALDVILLLFWGGNFAVFCLGMFKLLLKVKYGFLHGFGGANSKVVMSGLKILGVHLEICLAKFLV